MFGTKSPDLFGQIQESLANFLVTSAAKKPSILSMKRDLIKAVDLAKREMTPEAEDAVLLQIQKIEETWPTKSDLLDDPISTNLLDGEWDLLFTVAAFGNPGSGNDNSEMSRGVGGAVNATGIVVDTTAANTQTTQTFDVSTGRVANDIKRVVASPIGSIHTRLQVSGPFTKSLASGRRADVRFDRLELEAAKLKLTFDWIFDLIFALRKEEKNQPWLETTHLSETLRLGRGNKGSVFVLTKPE